MQKTAGLLKLVLCDAYALYLKTQNYHWNVEGPHFKCLHMLFEEQYKELGEAIDILAEEIRACGEKAPATFSFYQQNTTISAGEESLDWKQMLEDLIKSHVGMKKTVQKALEQAQEEKNEVVANLMTERLAVHGKSLWILRSCLL